MADEKVEPQPEPAITIRALTDIFYTLARPYIFAYPRMNVENTLREKIVTLEYKLGTAESNVRYYQDECAHKDREILELKKKTRQGYDNHG